ncbi:hypothetical protein Q1695_001396 [Nippostrongylus brasiliensis]|nr:hypothetical protein Q1695_001396 [Nippostrongylus brasiliensis]
MRNTVAYFLAVLCCLFLSSEPYYARPKAKGQNKQFAAAGGYAPKPPFPKPLYVVDGYVPEPPFPHHIPHAPNNRRECSECPRISVQKCKSNSKNNTCIEPEIDVWRPGRDCEAIIECSAPGYDVRSKSPTAEMGSGI